MSIIYSKLISLLPVWLKYPFMLDIYEQLSMEDKRLLNAIQLVVKAVQVVLFPTTLGLIMVQIGIWSHVFGYFINN